MSACPPPRLLHAHVDALLMPANAASIEEHLISCALCRDSVRSLKRVMTFIERHRGLASETEGRRLLERIPERMRAAATPASAKPRTVRRSFVLYGTFAASLALLMFLVIRTGSAPAPIKASPASPGMGALLLTLEPSLAPPPINDANFLRQAMERLPSFAHAATATGLERLALITEVRGAFERTSDEQERLALCRLAAALGTTDLRAALEVLLTSRATGDQELRYGLMVLASYRDAEAARALLRIASRRSVSPADLAEALIRTEAGFVATEVGRLLRAAGTDTDRLCVELGRIPGKSSSWQLVSMFLAGADSPALVRVLAGRKDARAMLRQELLGRRGAERLRLLDLLARINDPAVVPLLENTLRQGGDRVPTLTALRRAVEEGSVEALLAAVRALPDLEHPSEWDRFEGHEILEATFSGAPEKLRHLIVAMASERRSWRSAERRRLLIALGLTREPSAFPELVRSLERAGERRAALTALALHGDRSAISAAAPWLDCSDRATRNCAFVVVARVGGLEAAQLLAKALARTRDRRTVLETVSKLQEPWVAVVFSAGLVYRDSHDFCRSSLDGLVRTVKGIP